MDITNLYTKDNADRGQWLEVLDPNGKDSGLRLKITGSHSDQFRRALAEAQAKQLNREKGRGRKDVTADELELEFDLMAGVMAACTLDWKDAEGNALTDGGKPFDCTLANAKAVYENAPDIRRQAFAFASDTRNYFLSPNSAEPSESD